KHLKQHHNIKPKQAGIAFRCDCGRECYSTCHHVNGKRCEISQFTMIRVTEATSASLNEKATVTVETPKEMSLANMISKTSSSVLPATTKHK
ncbi:hypothetical protein PFISCL1PPCAC_11090, partial [Pristionchus fissidentatus]